MTDEELHEAIKPLVDEHGHLACKQALGLAARLEINPARIGKICNQQGIRIVNCQLGCFGTKPKRRN